jgi:nitrite reductase (NADH) small subunit
MNTANATKWYLIAGGSLFPKQEGKRIRFQEYDIAIFNLGNDCFKAIDNTCPHKQGPLADGIVAGDSVFCPLHSLKISLQSGCALGEKKQVKTYPVQVREGAIYVAFEEGHFENCESDHI